MTANGTPDRGVEQRNTLIAQRDKLAEFVREALKGEEYFEDTHRVLLGSVSVSQALAARAALKELEED